MATFLQPHLIHSPAKIQNTKSSRNIQKYPTYKHEISLPTNTFVTSTYILYVVNNIYFLYKFPLVRAPVFEVWTEKLRVPVRVVL